MKDKIDEKEIITIITRIKTIIMSFFLFLFFFFFLSRSKIENYKYTWHHNLPYLFSNDNLAGTSMHTTKTETIIQITPEKTKNIWNFLWN